MGRLHEDTAVTGRDGKLFVDLRRDWDIWGPNGGYVAAIALRAAGKLAPPDHRPATLSVQYLSAGKYEEAEAVVEPVKQGRSAWCINVALVQAGKRFLQAQVWTTNRQIGPRSNELTMPIVPRPAMLKIYGEIYPRESETFMFWDNFEVKPTRIHNRDDPPGAPVVQEWYRYPGFEAGGDIFADFTRPVILIDTLQWPAHHRGLAAYPNYIAPSLDLSVWFHEAPGDADWLFADVHTPTAGHGLIHGVARVWSEDGRLLATGSSNMLVTPRG
ncbi:MAG: thioesterase family protein [Rhizomicrobium sp.]